MATRPAGSTLTGHLLCAVPQLLDPNFARSVVFLVEHGEDGAFGLVINATASARMVDVAEALGIHWGGEDDVCARVGGPCEPARGFILHDSPTLDPEARELLPGLFLSTSLSTLEQADHARKVDDRLVLGGGRHQVVLFLGYAGWGPGQLEGELAVGSWVAVKVRSPGESGLGVTPRFVLDAPPESAWEQALGALGIDPSRLVGLSGGGLDVH